MKEPIRETPKTYSQKDLDLARKQGYEIAEELYRAVIKNLKLQFKNVRRSKWKK
jgi:hypothetical protein